MAHALSVASYYRFVTFGGRVVPTSVLGCCALTTFSTVIIMVDMLDFLTFNTMTADIDIVAFCCFYSMPPAGPIKDLGILMMDYFLNIGQTSSCLPSDLPSETRIRLA